MSSATRSTRDMTNLRRQFAVHTYRGYNSNLYFFTVNGQTLYRVEQDLENVPWVTARDMGAQRVIDSIDPAIIALWESGNQWSNIKVIRPGIARKFQVVSIIRGNEDSVGDNDGPAWNAEAYLNDNNTDIYNYQTNPINDMLIVGRSEIVNNENNDHQSLPFGTFWAINDPIVIEYTYSDVVYRRAIRNRIDETSLLN